MAESDIAIIPQDQTVSDKVVVVTDFERRRGYSFDAVTRHATQRSYRPTRHSVPSGASITDHVTTDPVAFRLVGVLTPYNVISIPTIARAFAGAVSGSAIISRLLERGAETALDTTRKARDQLVQFADDHTLLTVMGDDFQHSNMIITRISDPRTPALGDSYELTVSFRQIRIPSQSSRIAPLISDDADALGGGAVQDVGQ